MGSSVHSDSNFRDEFIEGAARAFFVCGYADYCDEEEIDDDRSDLPQPGAGGDWMDYAPADMPGHAYALAGELWAGLASMNDVGCGVYSLAEQAATADGIDRDDLDENNFGHYLAMEAMGHGVSWFDDHEKFPLEVPTIECHAFSFDPAAYRPGSSQTRRAYDK